MHARLTRRESGSLITFAAVALLTLTNASFGQHDSRQSVLPTEIPWSGDSERLVAAPGDPWITPSEASGLTRTPRYDETVEWLRKLVEASPSLRMLSIGRSAQGRDIWMVVASKEGANDASSLRRNGRPTILAQAGIHSGEIDGKDAGLMLLRDMTVGGSKSDLLNAVNLLFIPILSVDGHERFSAFNRINQRGPEEMGWRTNARNENLNRDYAKLDTEEVRAVVSVISSWQPDLYLDLHVTDGADYQYDVTYGYNGAHAWSPDIAAWLDNHYRPAVDAALTSNGHIPGPLIFSANGRDMSGGNFDWTASPRFSSGYGDLRHLPTVLLENHSLKPYRQRVLGTYVFLEASLNAVASGYQELRAATVADRDRRREEVPLGWSVPSDSPPGRMKLNGIGSRSRLSAVSGSLVTEWTGETVVQEIPVLSMTKPTPIAARPRAYFVPVEWSLITDRLELHGIEVERISEARDEEVTVYRLPGASLEGDPFEGRARVKPGAPVQEQRTITLLPGSAVVSTDQPLGDLAIVLLEPESVDSYFQWGFFLSVLQQTEYFEPYIMEPTAARMLEMDPELRSAFEEKILNDPEFAGSADARLRWFYEKTPYVDATYRLYPIARSR